MKEKIRLSIIIPCYNEEGNIVECVSRIPKLKYPYEIIVVDDGSEDNTVKTAKSIKRKELRVITYKPNRGKGYACRTGIKHARGDIVIICDADMATPPEEIPAVVKPILGGKADFVNTSRLIYPMEKGAMKPIHIPGNRIFALMVSLIIGKKLTDTLSGFKAFRKDMLLSKLKENSWPDFEMIIKAKRNGLRIAEVPIHYKARRAGVSKMKTVRHAYKMFMMLMRSLSK